MSCYMFETRDPLIHEMYGCVCACMGGGRDPTPVARRARRREVFRNTGRWVAGTIAAIAIGTTAAVAQKIQDRHPAYAEQGLTFEQRWDAVREIPLTFEQRWQPVRQLMVREAFGEVLRPRAEAETPPAARAVRTRAIRVAAAPRPAETPIARSGEERAICVRHRMRTVWRGRSWNCRR